MYWYLQALYEHKDAGDVILKIDFVNGDNNQSYTAIKKFSIDKDFITNKENRAPKMQELEMVCGYSLQLSELIRINDKYINTRAVTAPHELCADFNCGICAEVDLPVKATGDIVMLLFREPFGGNLLFFKKNGYELSAKVYVPDGINLKLEIKNDRGICFVDMNIRQAEVLQEIKVPLDGIDDGDLQNVKELCFTTFKSDDGDVRGEYYIFDCCMRKKD